MHKPLTAPPTAVPIIVPARVVSITAPTVVGISNAPVLKLLESGGPLPVSGGIGAAEAGGDGKELLSGNSVKLQSFAATPDLQHPIPGYWLSIEQVSVAAHATVVRKSR